MTFTSGVITFGSVAVLNQGLMSSVFIRLLLLLIPFVRAPYSNKSAFGSPVHIQCLQTVPNLLPPCSFAGSLLLR